MKSTASLILSIATLLTFVSCDEQAFHETKIFAGGVTATAAELNKGKQIYTEYCMACHGIKGDGKGVAARGMQVPPRDLTSGLYKFGKVIAGELPHDKDFYEIFRKGLHGTAMLPWDLKEGQMHAVVSYIKTFAPKVWEGKDKKLGEAIVITKDPYGLAHRSAAIQKGKEVYHAVANCQSCHRAYVSGDEMIQITKKVNDEVITAEDIDEDAYIVKPQETEWGFNSIPPEFTWDNVRSAKNVEELYVRLVSGVSGTAMPSWKDTISDEEIWAVAHYVDYLMSFKDKPEDRRKFMESIKK